MAAEATGSMANGLLDAATGKSGGHTFICLAESSVGSKGIWLKQNPMHYSTPILLLQLSMSSTTTLLFDSFLRPLGQTSIVSQFLGGLVFGPSALGNIVGQYLFPPRGSNIFETSAMFGLMFFFFVIGVKSDMKMMVQPGRMAMIIGLSVMVASLTFTLAAAFLLQKYVTMDPSLSKSIQLIACTQCLTAFPNISLLLTELKILNSDLGRLALSASMFTDIIGVLLTAVGLTIMSSKTVLDAALGISSIFGLVIVVFNVIKPLVSRYVLRHAQQGKLKETHIVTVFVILMIIGFSSELIGQHIVLGPIMLGLAFPDGPPLGSALVDKLHYPIFKILYPTYLTASGLKTNIFAIDWQSLWIVGFIFFFSSFVKIATIIVLACFNNMPTKDAFVVGLIMNARGVCELVLYNLFMNDRALTQQEFALSVLMVILITAIITPLIKLLYNPSNRLRPLRRRTIQHAKREEELRILVCIHNQENVPSLVNVLEASHASEDSPIAVIGVILVELVGRAAPILIAHQSNRNDTHSSAPKSAHIINALRTYESYNEGRVYLQAYTSASHFDTMHEDICKLALDQNTNIVIVPFHKTWAIDGNIGHVDRALRRFNLKIIEKIPCSLGILIDRGILTGSLSIINTQSVYNVAVIYIGGVDDIESLCYGVRMATHENVTLTVIRFLLFGGDTARERKFDNNLIDEIRHLQSGNERFMYKEELVRDGVGLSSAIRKFQQGFDLMIVGKHHQDSALMTGLDEWSECPELGVIGDLLASPDMHTTTSVLVVQQQRIGGKFASRSMKPVVVDTQLHGIPRMIRTSSSSGSSYGENNNNNNSWAISMNRGREY